MITPLALDICLVAALAGCHWVLPYDTIPSDGGGEAPAWDLAGDWAPADWGGHDAGKQAVFCKMLPTDAKNHLLGVWGHKSPITVYAVGEGGTVLRYKEDAETVAPLGHIPISTTLRGIWGPSSSELYVAGCDSLMNERVYHFEGLPADVKVTPITFQSGGCFHGAHGPSGKSGPLYLAGEKARIQAYSPGANGVLTSVDVDLLGVWAATSDQAFAVGLGGTVVSVRENDGSLSFPQKSTVVAGDLTAVWGHDHGDGRYRLFVASTTGEIWRVDTDGSNDILFKSIYQTEDQTPLHGIWGSVAHDRLFAVGDKGMVVDCSLAGQCRTKRISNKTYRAVWGIAEGMKRLLFIVGLDGAFIRCEW